MKYAYVWLLYGDKSYMEGLLTSIYSLDKTETKYDRVVMYTEDVKDVLCKLPSDIITFPIPYLKYPRKTLIHPLQEMIYADSSLLFTKWNALSLPYDKILLLDCDTIILQNIDDLFSLDTPAAPFSLPYVKPLGSIESFYKGKKSDGYLLHGEKILPDEISYSLNNYSTVLTASSVLLSPNIDDYKLFTEHFSQYTDANPFGFQKCFSGVSEQALAYFYAEIKKVSFTNIHHSYNYISEEKFLLTPPHVLHIVSKPKPWQSADVIKKYPLIVQNIILHNQHADDYTLWNKYNNARQQVDIYSTAYNSH